MDVRSTTDDTPVSPITGVVIILVVTLMLTAVVGLLLFDFTEDEPVPEVVWSLSNGDVPVLHHQGGDAVNCERIFIEGDHGSGEDLCTYFEEDIIQEGDSAALMDTGGEAGSIVLAWHDVETDRTLPIIQFDYPPT